MAVSLELHSDFNRVTTCSQPKKLGERKHLPIGVQTLQRAGAPMHGFTDLLTIPLGQGAAAKRDDAPPLRRPAPRCNPKGSHSIPRKAQHVIWESFAMVSAERPWCW